MTRLLRRFLVGVIFLCIGSVFIFLQRALLSAISSKESIVPPYTTRPVKESSKNYERIDFDRIPTFMRDYFDWHGEQLMQIQEDERKAIIQNRNGDVNATQAEDFLGKYRFLILRCTGKDRCGGLSDRLKGFPLFIWYAATTDRILLIRWGNDRPAPIESFLQPNWVWNWTVPNVLARKLDTMETESQPKNQSYETYRRFYFEAITKQDQIMDALKDPKVWMVEGNHAYGGEKIYHEFVTDALKKEEATRLSAGSSVSFFTLQPKDAIFANFYHELFHATFEPSKSVAKELSAYFYHPGQKVRSPSSQVQNLPSSWLPTPLRANNYVVAQFRATYPGEPYRKTQNREVLRKTTIHAVECAKARVQSPAFQGDESDQIQSVYVTSDTALVVEHAQEAYRNQTMNVGGADSPMTVWTSLDLQTYDGHNGTKQAVTLAEDPPHLNFAKRSDSAAFHIVFVDLFLMSYASCVVYGAGGFGRMGALTSFHPRCGTAFTINEGVLQNCEAYDASRD